MAETCAMQEVYAPFKKKKKTVDEMQECILCERPLKRLLPMEIAVCEAAF